MHYAKSWFYNFLIVYFANHLLPGIDLLHPTRLPHVGSDLLFAIALGLLNSLIYPVCKMVSHRTPLFRVIIIAIVLNFVAYAILKLLPIGIYLTSWEGYLLAAAVVTVGSIATNYCYMRWDRHAHTHRHTETSNPHAGNKSEDWKNPFS